MPPIFDKLFKRNSSAASTAQVDALYAQATSAISAGE